MAVCGPEQFCSAACTTPGLAAFVRAQDSTGSPAGFILPCGAGGPAPQRQGRGEHPTQLGGLSPPKTVWDCLE